VVINKCRRCRRSLLLSGGESGARVELEEDDVAVIHDVVPPLLPVFAGGL